MDPSKHTEQRLTDLEIKASFAEDLLDQLNQVIVRQQREIDLLMREVLQLRQHMPEAQGNAFGQVNQELPPHY